MKLPQTLTLGPINVRVLHRGDEFPCPSKGHPPFLHERDDPALVISRDGLILRVVPLSVAARAPLSVFRGRAGRKPWALTEEEVVSVVRWATRTRGQTRKAIPVNVADLPTIRVPKGKSGGQLRPKARTIPLASREMAGDCDYRHKLPAYERAYHDQFFRETVLNRWYDKDGVIALYPRGSEARRKLQFDYNRRQDDMLTHRDWFREDPGPARNAEDIGESAYEGHSLRQIDSVDRGASSPEDDIIDAIDRSRE